ncbi:MAG: hypothetical protein OHK0046_04130 [Anaerolineae bacterium]
MQRERVTEDIYVFTSDLYAQVTASLILTKEGAVLIDTLAYPEETRQIKRFVEDRLGARVRFLVNSHFHADHTTGSYLFPEAMVIGHALCRKLLDERGRESLDLARSTSVELREVELVLPNIVFEERLTLHLGGKTLEFWATPGHSPDSIVCYIEEEQVLFASDSVMPIPYFVDGDYITFLKTLHVLKDLLNTRPVDSIIQGHGEVILRGEVEEKILGDINYLVKLRQAVEVALTSASPSKALSAIDIEDCGRSRILLNGAVQQLHRQNVTWLAEQGRELLQLHYDTLEKD